MFPKQTLAKKLNVEIATSAVMDNAIQLWANMYKDHPPWLGGGANIKSLNLPATISEELARLVLTEFKAEISGSRRADFIHNALSTTFNNLSNIVEMWCALGGIALKPYAAGEDAVTKNPTTIIVDVVQANRFYPTAFDSNKEVTGAIFLETKRIGDYAYTRIEYHSLVGTHYTVINKAFRSERLNTPLVEDENINVQHPFSEEISLEEIDDWKGLQPKTEIDGLEKPLFVYIKTPRANTVDTQSPLGASMFSRAVEIIKEADKQYSRILWEYEAKEAAIDADETLFKSDKKGNSILPVGRERLYRTYEFDNAGNGKSSFIQAYSPEIRDSSMFNGLNKLYRQIEVLCGLAYGTLSDVADVQKTATEIKASKQRSYTTVNAMQKSWEQGLSNLVYAMDMICSLYKLTPAGVVNTTLTWGDGVLEDTDVEYQRRWEMVLSGKLKIEKFYAWYFGCSEEEAAEMIPSGVSYPPPE